MEVLVPLHPDFIVFAGLWLQVVVELNSSRVLEGDGFFYRGSLGADRPGPARAQRPNDESPNMIGGHADNTTSQGAVGATIAGGGSEGPLNRAMGDDGTIGGGLIYSADGTFATGCGNEIPTQSWNYKAEEDSVHLLGPMAKDLHAAYGLGGDDKTIATVGADGVTLAATQGLHEIVREKGAEFAVSRRQKAVVRARLETLEARWAGLR